MTQRRKSLPIGFDDFGEIRKNDFYYIDKTGLIADLLNNWCKVTLFTRPRRFGKSLNMSMLEAFFSPDTDKSIFDGLKISEETELCREYMGQYPVLSISLKDIDAVDFDTAYEQICLIIKREAARVDMLIASEDRIHEFERRELDRLLMNDINAADLYASLYTLSGILEKHYGQKTIVLIDEYDVPLSKAREYGYYDRMVLLIGNLFQYVLKTNRSLKFAVLTGCMWILKGSIITGLNNLRVLGVTDKRMDEYFGFTDQEVRKLLAYYDLSDRYEEVQEWYDGYRFGSVNVYCPWDVVNYVDNARFGTNSFPENYWVNSSGNAVVRRLIGHSWNASVKWDLEALINGEAVEKTIRQNLTYEDMYASIDNIWSVLFTMGYLTQKERLSGTRFRLVIPNLEVRNIYVEQILDLFRENVEKDGESHLRICEALENRDTAAAEKSLGEYLRRTISIRDAEVRKSLRENFYQGILLAILSVRAGWSVTSNQEAGDGYADIIVRSEDYELAMILEHKYADDRDMEAVCRRGLEQIRGRNYAQRLYEEGYERVLEYGVAVRLKKCRIMLRGE